MQGFRKCFYALLLTPLASVAWATDQNVTPDVILGSGISNGSFTVNEANSVQLGLRGKLRFNASNQAENMFNSNGTGGYLFTAGKAPTGFGFAPPPNNTPVWSVDWSVNTNFDNGAPGRNLGDLTYEIGLDFDPSGSTNFLTWDPITVPDTIPFYPPLTTVFWDHSIGTNATGNGMGVEANDAPTYATLLANNNVAQNSWNYEFFNNSPFNTFDATVAGDYEVYLKAFDGNTELASTTIHIIVVNPTNVLKLESTTCPNDANGASGHQIAVEVWMRHLLQDTRGFQAFVQYDTAKLLYRGDLSTYTNAPFDFHVQPLSSAQTSPGHLRLDGGAMAATTSDSLLATLIFDVVDDCTTTVVSFDTSGPFPSELSNTVPIATSLLNSPAMTLDDMVPVMTCPADTTVECDQPSDADSIGAGGHFQGFEDPGFVSNTAPDWNDYNSVLSRVATGTNGVLSRTGGYHAVIDSTILPDAPNDFSGAFTRLGGYDNSFGAGFRTAIDVYMDLSDMAVGADTYGWDLSSAVNGQDGNHRRDFIFHTAGSPGQILVGASNGSNFTRRNDLGSINHYTITASGWYTFEWVFRDYGDGTLAVDLNLHSASGTLLWTETRHDASDVIATVVGGHRYMWFTFLEVNELAIDNTLFRDNPYATDNCDTSPYIWSTDSVSVGACAGESTILRTWHATDDCNNVASCVQTIQVVDSTPPHATAPNTADLECSDDIPAAANTIAGFLALPGTSASDNCTDQSNLTVSHSDGPLVGTECNGTISRTYTITDDCGNSTDVVQVFTVTDDTDPVIDPCPSDITQAADPGCAGANVTYTVPGATDNCDNAVAVGCGPIASGGEFPIGTTTITCTATDDCLNTDTCAFDVTVTATNEIHVTVELFGVDATTPFSRCIRFTPMDASSQCGDEVNQVLNFSGNPATATDTVVVECGAWVNLCVKDEQHTLNETVALTDAGAYYSTPLASLRSGDTDNDSDVDINDVTWLLFTYGHEAAPGDCPWNGTRDADFDNDNAVGLVDYDLLATNWLQYTTCACTGPIDQGEDPFDTADPEGVLQADSKIRLQRPAGLRSKLDVSELPAEVAAKADLNQDGVVDYRDVRIFEKANGLPSTLSARMAK